jgi:hypothetical protein
MNVTTLDGFKYSLTSSFVKMSPVLQMLKLHITHKDQHELPVTLKTLLNAVKFCAIIDQNQVPMQEPIPDTTVYFSELVSQQEYEFVDSLNSDSKEDEIKNLFEFADYIDFKKLRRLMAKTIAFKIKRCKNVEDIREQFGLVNDIDEKEYAKLEEDSKCLH